MNIVIVILTILFISGIGYTILRGFNLLSQKDNLLAIGFSYGMGVGLVAMQLYVYSRLNIAWQKELLLFPWLVLIGVLLIRNIRHIGFEFPKISTLRKIELFLLAGILLSIGYTIFEALLRPLTVWDGWSTWLLESKVFFIDGKINPHVFNYLDSTYPLIYKLFGTFIYIMLGKVDDTAVLLTSSAFYVFLAISLFSIINKKYGRTYALLFTFLFISTQNFIRHGGRIEAGIADLPLGYFSFMCSLLLLEYLKKNGGKTLLLLNIFLGFTQLIKVEGTFFVIAVESIILVHIYKNKLYEQLWYLLFWILPLLDWHIYRTLNHLNKNYFSVFGLGISFEKTFYSFWGTFKELINIKSWNMLWIIYFYSLCVVGMKKNKELLVLNIIILSQLIIYLLIYIFTIGSSPDSSIERLLLHVAPLVFYNLAIIVNIKLKKM